ncbi:MAG: hypothetical protein C5B50_12905 [Verrucomicrobia bacterium]|nr:MAG: hypothetical protein C5B50_12905 [Verrucomicrobiota bacterium]
MCLAPNLREAYLQHVSIEAIRNELRALPSAERRKLMAFMVALEDEGREGYAAKLAKRIDDRSPERWLTPEQCERELGLPSERDPK